MWVNLDPLVVARLQPGFPYVFLIKRYNSLWALADHMTNPVSRIALDPKSGQVIDTVVRDLLERGKGVRELFCGV
jgi:hypothetical protein